MKLHSGIGKRFSPYKHFRRVSVIPNSLMRYTGLSHGAKLVWARLAQYAGADGRAYPAVATLAQEVGLKKRQTQNLLAELKAKRFIESELGPRANVYYFILHPALVEEGVQNSASGDAKLCPSHMQENASKETKEKPQRKETTRQSVGRRVSFEDLSEKEQSYIELKVAFEFAMGNIRKTPTAYRAGLVKTAVEGCLDISGLGDLESWGRGEPSSIKGGMNSATLDRIKEYQRHDRRSPQDICKLIKMQEKKGANKFWGLPIREVSMGMKLLFPDKII